MDIEDEVHKRIQRFRAAFLNMDIDLGYAEAINILAIAGARHYLESPALTPNYIEEIKRELRRLRLFEKNGGGRKRSQALLQTAEGR